MSIWKKTSFVLVTVLLFMAALELSARVFLFAAKGPSGMELFHAKQTLIYGPLFKDEGQKHLSNRLGFRGPDFKIAKDKGTYRVLTIGGSAAGGELSNEIRKLFEADCPAQKCELIDGGVAGNVSIHQLYNLTRWMAYAPDLVIVFDGWNDIYYSHYTPERYEQQYGMVSRLIRKWHGANLSFIRASYFLQTALYARKNIGNFLDPPAHAEEPAANELQISWMGGPTTVNLDTKIAQDVFSEKYGRNLEKMAEVTKIAGVPIYFMLQPSLANIGLKQGFNAAGQKTLETISPKAQADWLKASALLLPLAQKAQAEACRRTGSPCYDFNEDPGMKQEYFSDLVHLNLEGNVWVAGRIKELTRELLPKPKT